MAEISIEIKNEYFLVVISVILDLDILRPRFICNSFPPLVKKISRSIKILIFDEVNQINSKIALFCFFWNNYEITIPFIIISILVLISGFTVINPNESRVLTFFGRYVGTVTMNGFVWTIPITQKQKVSLRFVNFTSPKLKVNDSNGNPIEIGSVIVWRVENAAKALFTVDAYQEFISNQSEIVIRSIAAQYPYDAEGRTSLRGSTGEITEKFVSELQEKLHIAGIFIKDAKISHLAYSPEIAVAMLRRQQAEAVLFARRRLVEGALGIVDDVLKHYKKQDIDLSKENQIELINNLLVTLTSDKEANPIVNVGK